MSTKSDLVNVRHRLSGSDIGVHVGASRRRDAQTQREMSRLIFDNCFPGGSWLEELKFHERLIVAT